MALPSDFQFSQGVLQDYIECPRRFELRYLERRAWPAMRAEPATDYERFLELGSAFHRLVHRHLAGVPLERLTETVEDEDLMRWWRAYQESGPADLPAARYPEITLSAPLAGYRAVAKYDLIAADPGKRAVIVDWKTSHRRPSRERLAARMQTRLYPYLLAQAGAELDGGEPLAPQQIEMVYWFANFPTEPERFSYDARQYAENAAALGALVHEIKERAAADDFPMTLEERRCLYCAYRSLCRRGVTAGQWDALDDEGEARDDFVLDFEQVAEVEY